MTEQNRVAQGKPRQSPEAKLLTAAKRLFCKEGIHATGVARVVKEAGVSRKTLYERYGSKDNLLRAVFEEEAAMWVNWFERDIAGQKQGLNAQIDLLFDLLKDWFNSRGFYGCVFINAVAEHEKQDGWIREVAASHRDKINAYIEAMLTADRLPDAKQATEKISFIIDGAIIAAMIDSNGEFVADTALAACRDVIESHRRNASPPSPGLTTTENRRHGHVTCP